MNLCTESISCIVIDNYSVTNLLDQKFFEESEKEASPHYIKNLRSHFKEDSSRKEKGYHRQLPIAHINESIGSAFYYIFNVTRMQKYYSN